jgi:hypothetical protein
MKILHFIIFIADHGSRIGSSYSYRGSIEDPDPNPDPVPGILYHCTTSLSLSFVPQLSILHLSQQYRFMEHIFLILVYFICAVCDSHPNTTTNEIIT